MKKIYKLGILLSAAVLFASLTSAQFKAERYWIMGNGTPANPTPVEYKQPDGTTVTVHLKGDRAIHWAVTNDGYSLLQNQAGYYEYATISADGKMVSSGLVAHNSANRTQEELNYLTKIQAGLKFSDTQIQEKLTTYKNKTKGGQFKSFPSSGTRKNLVILMEFPDLSLTASASDFDDLMNLDGYGSCGSFRDFHSENSFGDLTINTTVKGPYISSDYYSHYGQNDLQGNDMYAEELIAEAVDAAEADNTDFSEFDNDGDGAVEAVYVIYAGYGEASSSVDDDIWPHASNIASVTYDGVTIQPYACSSELNGYSPSTDITGIGTICHEFGHSLGLPDFYDTDYSGSGGDAEGTGSWDCMAGGNYNGSGNCPANHNALSKAYLDWISVQEFTGSGNVSIPNANDNDVAYSILTTTTDEMFLLENRQLTGFDSYLPGHGLLIYHYDGAYCASHIDDNTVNVDPNHQGFDVEEADGDAIYGNEDGDPFPGTSNKYSFTDGTNPGSLSWAGANTGKPVTNITESGSPGVISCNVQSGINEVTIGKGYVVYPNPVSDNFVVTGGERNIISIYNPVGQLLIQKQVSKSEPVNVSGLAKGVYTVKIGNSYSKLVKQ